MKRIQDLTAALTMLGVLAFAQTDVRAADTQAVQIRFVAEINGAPFACGRQFGPVGSSASKIIPTDYRMFVSEVHLIEHDGRRVPVKLDQDDAFQFENIALLDFEDGSGPCRNGTAAINASVRGVVPKGAYRGLGFVVGVPFERNHGDPTLAPAPLSSTAMFWTWQGGYKFIRFDAALAEPGTGFALHLGSTRCASAARTAPPSSCALGNRMTIEFDDFEPDRHTVVIDVGPVLADSRLDYNSPKTSPGCMSFPGDPDCVPIMHRLGLQYDGATGGPQRLITRR